MMKTIMISVREVYKEDLSEFAWLIFKRQDSWDSRIENYNLTNTVYFYPCSVYIISCSNRFTISLLIEENTNQTDS